MGDRSSHQSHPERFGSSDSYASYTVAEVITSLFHAVLVQDTDYLDEVLEEFSLDPNEIWDKDGKTMLMVAATENKHEVVRFLLSLSSVDVDMQDDEGESALYHAATAGSTESVQLLLLAGASANIGNKQGTPPLTIAAYSGHVTVCRLLILLGQANVNQQDNTKKSALILASYAGHVRIIEELVLRNAKLNTLDQYGWSSLMLAAYAGRYAACQLLLEYGADPSIRTSNGKTAQSLAKDAGHHTIATYLANFQMQSMTNSRPTSWTPGSTSGNNTLTNGRNMLPPIPIPPSPSRRNHSPAPSLPSVPENPEDDTYETNATPNRYSYSGFSSSAAAHQRYLSSRLATPPTSPLPQLSASPPTNVLSRVGAPPVASQSLPAEHDKEQDFQDIDERPVVQLQKIDKQKQKLKRQASKDNVKSDTPTVAVATLATTSNTTLSLVKATVDLLSSPQPTKNEDLDMDVGMGLNMTMDEERHERSPQCLDIIADSLPSPASPMPTPVPRSVTVIVPLPSAVETENGVEFSNTPTPKQELKSERVSDPSLDQQRISIATTSSAATTVVADADRQSLAKDLGISTLTSKSSSNQQFFQNPIKLVTFWSSRNSNKGNNGNNTHSENDARVESEDTKREKKRKREYRRRDRIGHNTPKIGVGRDASPNDTTVISQDSLTESTQRKQQKTSMQQPSHQAGIMGSNRVSRLLSCFPFRSSTTTVNKTNQGEEVDTAGQYFDDDHDEDSEDEGDLIEPEISEEHPAATGSQSGQPSSGLRKTKGLVQQLELEREDEDSEVEDPGCWQLMNPLVYVL